ncbi:MULTISPECIES: chloride channel protein [unclassified Isoptericola]|uniref:chloride channel protein n=1 Tax=unclassified Isoptericola TaxID=2623355 RepID=UPI0027139EAC|nr:MULTISPECIES: chloride channel protein [unclassified Isoptericola]MDO8145088.1 chloride channel protein [Isoptericola sp. 178]MDO8151332.1 chloride channel protein [Isoptericola sp. b408]
MTAEQPPSDPAPAEEDLTPEQRAARTRGYVGVLLLAAGIGVPVSLVAFGFLALLHALEHAVWETWPATFGHEVAPWWWALPWLLLGGVLVGVAVRWLPGHGGHVPIDGLGIDPVPARFVPGILLAALGGLPLGVVLGPEAPLLALGSAVALLLVRPVAASGAPGAGALITVAGAAAALAAIFGSPLVAAIFVLEAAGLAGPRLARVVLPCLLSAGIGSLVFTGMGTWTGLQIPSLALPDLAGPDRPDLGDVLWTVPFAVATAFAVRQVHHLGRWTARRAADRPLSAAVGAALVVGGCAGAYALLTGRSPEEVALSGQGLLEPLAADPGAWSAPVLVALLAFKSIGYGVSLGALRGGAIFPAVLLGAAAGVLVSGLPGYGVIPAMAAGMAAATAAILPYPVASAVLVVVLLGSNAAAMTPVVLLAVVVAFVSEQIIATERRRPV